MKSVFRKILILGFIALFPLFTFAQPQPPAGGGTPGTGPGAQPVGGAAPVGSGIVLLISLAAAYGSKKVYDARKKLKE
jgi:hypothetical protein